MTAVRTTKAARPVGATILLPESPFRSCAWNQIYARLARPTLDRPGVDRGGMAALVRDRAADPASFEGTIPAPAQGGAGGPVTSPASSDLAKLETHLQERRNV